MEFICCKENMRTLFFLPTICKIERKEGGGDLSDYLKNRDNFEYFMRGYKNDAYRNVMEWLDKKK